MLVLTIYILQVFRVDINMGLSAQYELDLQKKRRNLHLLILMLHANHVIFGIILSMWNPTWDAQFKMQGFAQIKEMEVLNKWGIEICNTYFMSNFIRKYV